MNRNVSARAEREMTVTIQAKRCPPDFCIGAHSTELSPKHARYRGIALVWTAIFGILIILLVGLSLDTARVALGLHQLNNSADAGALAGALFVKFDQNRARNSAITTAASNYAEQLTVSIDENLSNDPAGELVVGRWIRQLRQFVPTTVAPSAVKVVSRRLGQRENAPLFGLVFGAALANVPSTGLERHAIAWSRGSTGAGIIALAEDPTIYKSVGWNYPTGLLMDGGTVLDLRGVDPETGEPMMGDIQVNSGSISSPWDSFRLNGTSATIYAGEFNVSGTSNPNADDAGAWENLYADSAYPFSINPYSDPVIDPLLGLVPPNVDGMSIPVDGMGIPMADVIDNKYVSDHGELDPVTSQRTVTLLPGYYPGGINISSSGAKVILSGGADAIYALGGGNKGDSGLVATGGTLIANGAMIYVTGDLDGSHPRTEVVEWGKIDIGGNATVELTSRGDAMSPPQVEGEIGISIWQDRSNPTYGRIIGTSSINIIGTIYCGYNPMEVGGTSDHTGTQLIAGALNLHGNVSLGIAYDGRNAIEAYRSILVE